MVYFRYPSCMNEWPNLISVRRSDNFTPRRSLKSRVKYFPASFVVQSKCEYSEENQLFWHSSSSHWWWSNINAWLYSTLLRLGSSNMRLWAQLKCQSKWSSIVLLQFMWINQWQMSTKSHWRMIPCKRPVSTLSNCTRRERSRRFSTSLVGNLSRLCSISNYRTHLGSSPLPKPSHLLITIVRRQTKNS